MRIASGILLMLVAFWSIVGGACAGTFAPMAGQLAQRVGQVSAKAGPKAKAPADVAEHREFTELMQTAHRTAPLASSFGWLQALLGVLAFVVAVGWLAGRWRFAALTSIALMIASEIGWAALVRVNIQGAAGKIILLVGIAALIWKSPERWQPLVSEPSDGIETGSA